MKLINKIALGGMLGALITAQQLALAAIPNVSLTAFLIMMFAFKFDRQTNIFIIITYLVSRNLWFGSPPNIWALYIIVFGGISIICSIFKKALDNIYIACAISIVIGFAVGIVSAITSVWLAGMRVEEIWPYIVRGIPYDLIHGISNAVIFILLYDPVGKVLERQIRNLTRTNSLQKRK